MKVYNIEEAKIWFLSNSTGSVICVKGDEEREVNCFPYAERFFNIQKDPRQRRITPAT